MKRFFIIFFIFQYALLLTMYGVFAQPNQDFIDQSTAIIKSSSSHAERETRNLEDLLLACEEDEDGDESVSARKQSFIGHYFLVARYGFMLVNLYQHVMEFLSSQSFGELATLERHIVYRAFRL